MTTFYNGQEVEVAIRHRQDWHKAKITRATCYKDVTQSMIIIYEVQLSDGTYYAVTPNRIRTVPMILYHKRLWLAIHLGLWSHRWLLTRQEILQYNADGYDKAKGRAIDCHNLWE